MADVKELVPGVFEIDGQDIAFEPARGLDTLGRPITRVNVLLWVTMAFAWTRLYTGGVMAVDEETFTRDWWNYWTKEDGKRKHANGKRGAPARLDYRYRQGENN